VIFNDYFITRLLLSPTVKDVNRSNFGKVMGNSMVSCLLTHGVLRHACKHSCTRKTVYGVFTAYKMLLIAVSYRRCGRNLWAKLYTASNSLSANHAYLKMLYISAKHRNFENHSSSVTVQIISAC